MASADENLALATETAEALLTATRQQAHRWAAPSDLLAMTQAYATFPDAMPKPRGRAVMA